MGGVRTGVCELFGRMYFDKHMSIYEIMYETGEPTDVIVTRIRNWARMSGLPIKGVSIKNSPGYMSPGQMRVNQAGDMFYRQGMRVTDIAKELSIKPITVYKNIEKYAMQHNMSKPTEYPYNLIADLYKEVTGISNSIIQDNAAEYLESIIKQQVAPEGQDVIHEHYRNYISFANIGCRKGVSRQRIEQIRTKALERIKMNVKYSQLFKENMIENNEQYRILVEKYGGDKESEDIRDQGFSIALRNVLLRNGINKVSDIPDINACIKLRGMGAKKLNELQTYLRNKSINCETGRAIYLVCTDLDTNETYYLARPRTQDTAALYSYLDCNKKNTTTLEITAHNPLLKMPEAKKCNKDTDFIQKLIA